jgi:hypothetical protein
MGLRVCTKGKLAQVQMATFVPGRAITRYKCEAFVPSREEETQTRPCELTFVPDGGSNRYKCPHLYRGQKNPLQMKNWARDKCRILW